MLSKDDFGQQVDKLRNEISEMNGVDDPVVIARTATRLLGLNYTPPVGIDVPLFLSLTTAALIKEIDRISGLADEQLAATRPVDESPWDSKFQQISVLVFYFRELAELRRGVPEAWDEVDELYVHD